MNKVEGKEGYLFHDAEGIFTSLATPIGYGDIECWKELSDFRVAECFESGAQYLTLVAPEKAVVMSHLLPEEIVIHPSRPARVLPGHIRERMLYPYDALTVNVEHPTYGPHETHWNDYGAYLTYVELIKRLGQLSGRDLYYVRNPEFYLADGNGYCDVGDPTPRWTYKPAKVTGKCIFDNLIWSRGNVKVCVNENRSLPKLLLFRDSFANTLMQYLVESFSRIVAVSSWHCLYDLIVSEVPDFVVMQLAERYMLPENYISHSCCYLFCKMTTRDIRGIGA